MIPTTLHIITGLNDGGAEAVLYRLCLHDKASRHHVVSLMDAGKYGPLLEQAGVVVTCLNMTRGWVSAGAMWRLWQLIRRVRPDVVQTWMYHADLLGGGVARLAGRRNIIWGIHHTTLEPGKNPRGTIAVARCCARLSRVVPKAIVCCAKRSREVHATLGYDATRMRVIPNGYDLSVFYRDPLAGATLRANLDIAPDLPLIGFVARYDPLKDHATLLQALAVLKDGGRAPCCLLIGTGLDADNATLTAQIAALGLEGHVRLLGRRSDIPAVMNALDLHVMSSSGEAFPNVLAEAMACATPCVTTDVGDAAVIVGNTGWVVPSGNPAALAHAIAQAMAERGTPAWQARRSAARNRIETRFAIGRMVESYQAVWAGRTEKDG